ncbi:hypothetical protein C2G38_2065265 [Gigaspora rosea]|uniref:Uncharacterized protein n=1 Tax=Gigaspora rosea TaxID=44941 RepID=A0A397VUM0_9GLOM|nr:hypothetical protein C2G38_2065265 [Gigaspora rosea]
MSKSERDAFITALVNELTVKIPTEKGRLSSNGHYHLTPLEKFLSTLVSKYLSQLIENGAYTGISTGTTTIYLDYIYGFQLTQSISDFFEMHKIEFIILIVTIGDSFIILQLGLALFRLVTFLIFVFTDSKTIPNLYISRYVFLNICRS